MTHALKKCPGVGNGQKNSEHGKFLKKQFEEVSFTHSFNKKKRKENGHR